MDSKKRRTPTELQKLPRKGAALNELTDRKRMIILAKTARFLQKAIKITIIDGIDGKEFQTPGRD